VVRVVPANLERVVEQTSRALQRLELEQLRGLRAYLEEAHRRLTRQLRALYSPALAGLTAESRVFREARARALLTQVDAALDALRLGSPATGVPTVMRNVIVLGRQQEAVQTRAILQELARASPVPLEEVERLLRMSASVNIATVEAQVANATARLVRYSAEAVDRINTAVVNGLVQGSGWRPVAREVRRAVIGEPGVPGGLAFQAETIARTELISSLQDARDDRYEAAGVKRVIWFATEDERTCEYCGARSGQIYDLSDVIIPAHPRCRCVASPVTREWVDAGVISASDLGEHRAAVRAEFERANPGKGFATGPSPFERAAGRTAAPRPVNP
jgi:SPP1 gp7 family putative phage head morphogenesis protein